MKLASALQRSIQAADTGRTGVARSAQAVRFFEDCDGKRQSKTRRHHDNRYCALYAADGIGL
jgi:predicted ATPase